MTAEDIKRIVDDERAEQLTAQLCRHWEVATRRLAELVQDLEGDMDTCVEAEVYATVMRLQSCVTALMELNKIPCFFLFSEYLERISQTVSNTSIRQSAITLLKRLFAEQPAKGKQRDSFFELLVQTMAQHKAMSPEKQQAIEQKISPLDDVFAFCAPYLPPNDLMMVASLIQEIQKENNADEQEEVVARVLEMRQVMDGLVGQMGNNTLNLHICLFLLVLMPGLLVNMNQQSRSNSKVMADLFHKVLEQARQSTEWWNYWKERRETLRVVSDDSSWKETMQAERSKERSVLGEIPGGLFAKWTTDRKAFEEDFLEARLDDDALRSFIFHLTTLYEIARELEPTTKYGDEQLVKNEQQQVGDAVLEAAGKLHDLVTNAWFPHYEAMWQELIQNEEIFNHLNVTRKSPHNNLFTARFFCHLVGEMKKSAVFGSHSDNDLAEKLTEKRYVGTFRKNIQEGMGGENIKMRKIFDAIYQKYKALAHSKK